jgi:hypothetical protein
VKATSTASLLGLLAVLFAAGCHHHVKCIGGAREVEYQCTCAEGQVWNGTSCQGEPKPGTCSGGYYQFGKDQCFCLDGFAPNGPQCIQLNCAGGSVVSGNECVCPSAKQWIDNKCQVPCVEGATRVDENSCACPPGAVSNGRKCVCPDGTYWDNTQCAALNCTGGAFASGNQCVCPANYTWIDNRCQVSCIEGAHRVDDHNCACPAGAVADNGRCVCPAGTFWDNANSQCSGLNCSGGAVPSGNECVCPGGYSWLDNRCQINCISGATRVDDHNCECPGGSLPMNGQCMCPDGSSWNGMRCILPPQAEQHHGYRQQHQSNLTGSKTLNINGCNYTDSANGSLGDLCGRNGACPSGYTCNTGFCVPANQGCRR